MAGREAAARRRSHRVRQESGDRGESRPPEASSDLSRPSRLPHLIFFIVFLAALGVFAVVYFRAPRSAGSTAIALSVHDRGLVKSDIEFSEILQEHSRVLDNRSLRHFPNSVLAFITPWNSVGYEMAKLFSSKLTHISPVWYDLKSEGNKLFLMGRNNADMEWISEIRKNWRSVVLPRVVLEAFPAELLKKKNQRSKAIDLIIAECKEMGYDGIVLESWSRWAAFGVLGDLDARSSALQFIKQLGQALHSQSSRHLELIYVIPAPQSQNVGPYDFGPQDLEDLADYIDGFSLMTYDYSSSQNPGPNAPLKWIRSSLQLLLSSVAGSRKHRRAHMIFLGINFYGNDYAISEGSGGESITGRDYLKLLEKHKPLMRWEENSEEHFFFYSSSDHNYNQKIHIVFYPTLKSISLRIQEAQAWDVGLSIWEIGQGLDYFFDLL